jgi:hypothetical protein
VPERAEVLPIGIELDHPGDDAGRGGLLGGDPGEVPQVLLGFANDLRIVVVLGFLVAGDDEGGFKRGDWLTSSITPTAKSANAKRCSPSVSSSARSPWPEQSMTLTCPSRY